MGAQMSEYKTPDNSNELHKCEYIEAMRKVYFEPPKQNNSICTGYKNKYTGTASKVCKRCKWYSEMG